MRKVNFLKTSLNCGVIYSSSLTCIAMDKNLNKKINNNLDKKINNKKLEYRSCVYLYDSEWLRGFSDQEIRKEFNENYKEKLFINSPFLKQKHGSENYIYQFNKDLFNKTLTYLNTLINRYKEHRSGRFDYDNFIKIVFFNENFITYNDNYNNLQNEIKNIQIDFLNSKKNNLLSYFASNTKNKLSLNENMKIDEIRTKLFNLLGDYNNEEVFDKIIGYNDKYSFDGKFKENIFNFYLKCVDEYLTDKNLKESLLNKVKKNNFLESFSKSLLLYNNFFIGHIYDLKNEHIYNLKSLSDFLFNLFKNRDFFENIPEKIEDGILISLNNFNWKKFEKLNYIRYNENEKAIPFIKSIYKDKFIKNLKDFFEKNFEYYPKKIIFENKNSTNYFYFKDKLNKYNLKNIISITLIKADDLESLFEDIKSLKHFELDKNFIFSTENSSMEKMFKNCTNLEDANFNNYNFGSIKNAKSAFKNCKNLKNIKDLKLQNAVNLISFISGCKNIKNTEYLNLVGSNTKFIGSMFEGTGVTSVDLSKYPNLQNVNLCHLFKNCEKLSSINCKGLNDNDLVSGIVENCNNLKIFICDKKEIKNFKRIHKSSIEYCDKSKFVINENKDYIFESNESLKMDDFFIKPEKLHVTCCCQTVFEERYLIRNQKPFSINDIPVADSYNCLFCGYNRRIVIDNEIIYDDYYEPLLKNIHISNEFNSKN